MRWNCPHCGTSLAAQDQLFAKGWSFSKCYQCRGFALVRRTETNVIKVDQAPPGENVILPEHPNPSLSQVKEQVKSQASPIAPQSLVRKKEVFEPLFLPPLPPPPTRFFSKKKAPFAFLTSLVSIFGLVGLGFFLMQKQPSVSSPFTDRIQKKAMAPLLLQKGASLQGVQGPYYSGPGQQFPKIEADGLGKNFVVEEIQGPWMKLRPALEAKSHLFFWVAKESH